MEIIQIRDLSFTYPGCDREALKNINISIGQGDFVVICGESGSGKSTLVRILKSEIAPFGRLTGEIQYMGKPLGDNADIGYLGQNIENCIVTDMVIEELAFGPENQGLNSEQIRRRISEISSYFGIDEWLNKKTDELSGGQRQILALASVLASRPRVLILDEPMSSLDPVSADRLAELLHRVNEELGITVICVEHLLEKVYHLADSVILLEKGQTIQGTPDEVTRIVGEKKIFNSFPAAARLSTKLGENPVYTVKAGRKLLEKYSFKGLKRGDAKEEDSEKILTASNVSFAYDRKTPLIIRDCDLTVYAGTVTGILGGNGSGKSTLLKILAGAQNPQRGKIKRKTVSFMPQTSALCFLKDTLMEDFLRVCSDENTIKVMTDRLGLSALLGHHPHDLSGGEQTMAAVAMTLLQPADIYILDEPTAGMDGAAKILLAGLLREKAESGAAVVFATHDTEFSALAADRLCMCFDGSVTNPENTHGFLRENNFYTTPARLISGELADAVTVAEILEDVDG